jgi:cytochrome P450
MSDHTRHGSCYTTPPAQSLEIFEEARRCPVAHSSEHDGFYMLVNYSDVKSAMTDYRTFSSEPQVLRPMLPRKPIPALEMDPPRHSTWRAISSSAITAKTPETMEPLVRADMNLHIDTFIEKGVCDIVAELAEPVPAETTEIHDRRVRPRNDFLTHLGTAGVEGRRLDDRR